MYGEWGKDTMHGNAGNDFLFGNQNDDTLIGDTGNDMMTGGDGADTFVFSANQGEDFITDFSVAQGDRISIASGTNGVTTAAQALAHAHTDSSGNAVVDFGGTNYVMLIGVAASMLTTNSFVIV